MIGEFNFCYDVVVADATFFFSKVRLRNGANFESNFACVSANPLISGFGRLFCFFFLCHSFDRNRKDNELVAKPRQVKSDCVNGRS